MKKLLVLSALTAFAVSAFGQGQIVFQNRVTTTTAGVNPNTVDAKIFVDAIGGTAASGTEVRAALLGGAVGSIGSSLTGIGNLTLLASPTTGATWTTFRTGAAAGYLSTADMPRDSKLAYGSSGVFQVVAWTGNYTTWADAYTAGMSGLTKIGWSNVLPLPVSSSATDLNVPNLQGLQSFAVAMVPEPSTFALAGLGAAAMLIFRRRK